MTTSTVNRERVALLVAALRSGDYAQVTGALHIVEEGVGRGGTGGVDGYCCLGIACVVARANGCAVEEVEVDGDNVFRATIAGHPDDKFDESSGYLPTVVMNWYGFSEFDPKIDPAGVADGRAEEYRDLTATKVNDQLELDFVQIADAFEYTYLRDET